MILINLLPHREERRRQRKRAFFVGLGLAAGVGVLLAQEARAAAIARTGRDVVRRFNSSPRNRSSRSLGRARRVRRRTPHTDCPRRRLTAVGPPPRSPQTR